MIHTMKKNKIRPIAIGIFILKGKVLVFEGFDEVKRKVFYRPLGGAIKFGETGAEALRREIQEEIGNEIEDIVFLKMIENLFTCNGQAGHEIVLVYSGRLKGDDIYSNLEFTGHEDDGSEIKVKWVDISYFHDNPAMLVPEELLNLLQHLIDSTGQRE